MSALDQASVAAMSPDGEATSAYQVRATATGRGVFACRPITAGTSLFGEDDWVDDTERRDFSTMSAAQFEDLAPAVRVTFSHFAYNTAPERITGTFHPERVRHPTNFLNHSCDPNAGYDGNDAIIALRRIAQGEELRMDYGTFSFSFDHHFQCHCGAPWCRGAVRRDDWRTLVRAGLRLPGFMRPFANRALWG